jgi:voltage-gated potassium channel
MRPARTPPTAIQQLYAKIKYSVLALLAVNVTGTIGYKLLAGEQSSWLDCLYMTVITVTTVGYQETVPVSSIAGGRVFTMFVVIAGLCALWFCFSAITALILANEINISWRRQRMEQDIRKLQGHYILCGFGRVGRNVAAELDATGHHYVAIDRDANMLTQHKELRQPGLLYISGDASDDELLEAANIREAAGVFAVTGDDSLNLMIVMSTKHLHPAARIVARCHEVRNFDKIIRAGADQVISPDYSGGMSIASAMIRPTVANFLDEMLRDRYKRRFEEVTVPVTFQPIPLAQLNLNRESDYVLLAVHDGSEWLFNPDGDFVVQPRQGLVVMASPAGRSELERLLISNS